jgi:phenylalanyl-tRNA synthetase beta chain
VTTDTKNILLDTTGTDRKAVQTAVNILCTAFAEMGAGIKSVTIEGGEVPALGPTERVVSAAECNRVLGLDLDAKEIAACLERMRFGAEAIADERVRVQVPCYRADILHDWDIFEDVAISRGYEHFDPVLPATFTVAREHPVPQLMNTVRSILVGLGYVEMMPFTLTNERVSFEWMREEVHPGVVRLMRPISEEQTILRRSILPLLMETLQINRHRELPQRLFTVGDVVEDCHTFQKISAVSMHPEADFSEIYAATDIICRELGLTYTPVESACPSFIEGRRGDLMIGEKKAGVFGEVHPAVLNAFELDQPVAGLEIDLRAVQGSL